MAALRLVVGWIGSGDRDTGLNTRDVAVGVVVVGEFDSQVKKEEEEGTNLPGLAGSVARAYRGPRRSRLSMGLEVGSRVSPRVLATTSVGGGPSLTIMANGGTFRI